MKVIAYDPFLSEERADQMGVEKVELDELLPRADFITLHMPLTDKTRNILSTENIAKTKKGVRIINCARGGLVDEAALAGRDQVGPCRRRRLRRLRGRAGQAKARCSGSTNVVCTPHLGASTTEAQENVALQVAEQMSDYLLDRRGANALNMPSVTAEEAKVMGPWIKLADHLGAFVGQLTDEPIEEVNILLDGEAAEMNIKALDCAVIAGLLKPADLGGQHGLGAGDRRRPRHQDLDHHAGEVRRLRRLHQADRVKTADRERSIAGTVFSDGKPRFIQIKGITIDAEIGQHMLYTTNKDVPGIIGALGATMGAHGVNIANFTLGRTELGRRCDRAALCRCAGARRGAGRAAQDRAVPDGGVARIRGLSKPLASVRAPGETPGPLPRFCAAKGAPMRVYAIGDIHGYRGELRARPPADRRRTAPAPATTGRRSSISAISATGGPIPGG